MARSRALRLAWPIVPPAFHPPIVGPVIDPPNPPYPAPAGYQWAFVIDNGMRVTENGSRVIELVRAA